MMFVLFFCFCFFCFFIFFFPSSDFYFVEEVRVQSGTPAPARERVAVRYFVEEMGRGIIWTYFELRIMPIMYVMSKGCVNIVDQCLYWLYSRDSTDSTVPVECPLRGRLPQHGHRHQWQRWSSAHLGPSPSAAFVPANTCSQPLAATFAASFVSSHNQYQFHLT